MHFLLMEQAVNIVSIWLGYGRKHAVACEIVFICELSFFANRRLGAKIVIVYSIYQLYISENLKFEFFHEIK